MLFRLPFHDLRKKISKLVIVSSLSQRRLNVELKMTAETRPQLTVASESQFVAAFTEVKVRHRSIKSNSRSPQESPLPNSSRSGSSRQLRSQVYTGSVGPENFCYFVAHPAKNSENLFFTSRGFGRIVKAPVSITVTRDRTVARTTRSPDSSPCKRSSTV
jgi:hypothetical protein